jgi:V/A-type H+/Na+-transporting ATPase subunit F
LRFFCIGDEDTVGGFRLAGVSGRVATNPGEASAALDAAVSMADCGIIIITERLAEDIQRQIEAIRMERERPLILEIPGPEGPVPGRKGLREFVQEAVGMRIS